MIKKTATTILFIFSLLVIANPCFALRCNTGMLIDVGLTTDEVIKRCGEPESKEVWYKDKVLLRSRSIKTIIYENWIYGSQQVAGSWDYRLTFKNGILKKIRHISP